MNQILPAVLTAIEEIKQSFEGHKVEAVADGQGGARVTVYDLDIGEKFQQSRSAISFTIAHTYPASDVYPHFVAPRLAWKNGAGSMDGLSASDRHGIEGTQISRRSNGWNRDTDTAALKLQKVLQWLKAK